jgi:hypothetical protein
VPNLKHLDSRLPKAAAIPAADDAPEYARIPEACRRYGVSRSGLYRLAGEAKIRLVKLAGATLVDCGSVRAFMHTLPPASVRVPSSAA